MADGRNERARERTRIGVGGAPEGRFPVGPASRRDVLSPGGAAGLVLVLAAALTLPACASTSTDTLPSVTTELPAPTTLTTVVPPSLTAPLQTSVEEQVLSAVAGYWSTYFAANDPPDPTHPGYVEFFTGAALEKSRSNTRNRLETGHAIRRSGGNLFRSSPIVGQIAGDTALVHDCVVDDSVTFARVSGAVLNDAITTSLFRLTLLREGGSWRVAENLEVRRWDGVSQGCR